MKKLLIAGALLSALLGCYSSETNVSPVSSSPILGLGYKPLIPGIPLIIKIEKIYDDRCPETSNCFVAGDVDVTFVLIANLEYRKLIVSHPGYSGKPTRRQFSINGKNYLLILNKVLPARKANVPPSYDKYNVDFSIVKVK